jgi:ABC-2 type transport system permease protein
MTAALAYLTHRSIVNQLKRQAARLRNPRYALALLLGFGWLAVVLWHRGPATSGPPPGMAWIEIAAALGALLLVGWAWLGSPDARVLAFSPAEVTFLFPAPISRRGLIHYKLLRTQLVVLVNVGIWTALASGQQPGGSIWLRAASFWVLITTLALHRLAAALVRGSVAEHGRFGLRHRVVSVGLATSALAALGWGLWEVWPGLVAAARGGAPALREALGRAVSQPGIAAVLWPLRMLVRPLGASSLADWQAAMPLALGLLILHYIWVLRSDSAFEEAASEASLARARRHSGRSTGAGLDRSGRAPSPPLFRLSPTGSPAIALLWKNLAAVLRRRRALNLALGLALGGGILAIVSGDAESTLAQVTGGLALTWLGFVVVLGPQWIRNDLRRDLLYVDLLRSYPLRGWAIVAMEAGASAITLTLLELALVTLAYLAFLQDATLDLTLGDRSLLLGGAVLLLAPINLMATLLQNAAALLFPGWVRVGGPAAGVEALGQQLLSTTALWLALGLMLAAPAAISAVTFRALETVGIWWAAGLAVAGGLVVLGCEMLALVRWLGAVFERGESSR